jgi:DNA-binding Lrp family transcriptional regulator
LFKPVGITTLFGKKEFMPTAIVMLKTDRKRVTNIAEQLLELPDISEVYSISGRYDLMVIIKCGSIDKIEGVITDELLRTEGIVDSETMFAFRSYDKREGGKTVDVD